MKSSMKFLMFFIAMASALSLLTACGHTEEPFSCDADIDSWVKESLAEVRVMTRSEWLELEDTETERACYRAFTTEQRQKFWIDKLNEVLSLDWNDKEGKHIEEMLSFVAGNERIFSETHSDMDFEDIVDKFIYLWIEEGKEQLGWSDKIVYAIIATGNIMEDKHGNISNINYRQNIETRADADCGCSTESDWCNFGMLQDEFFPYPIVKECETGNCKTVGASCGTLYRYDCNGKCKTYVLKL